MTRRLPLDAVVVPGALLMIAHELLLFAPTEELAWQLFHDQRVARRSAWLGPLLPRPGEALDADPVALLLAALAAALAFAYLLAGWRGARPRVRAGLLVAAAAVLVVLPTLAFIGLGVATRVPHGHDGAVVQLPLAMDKVLAGESPYGADYSRSVLGRQARSSEFWAPLGGNPITRHHWYLPGVHLLMIPPYLLLRRALGFFDPRLVTLVFYFLAAWLASRLVAGAERRLAAAAIVLVHPLVWWPQAVGTNDVFCAVPLLLALLAAERGRPLLSAALLGLACAVKQLMWPFAPFLLVLLSGVSSWRGLLSVGGLRRLAKPALLCVSVAVAIVAPLALRDPQAFVNDIFRYQVGLPGEDQYPLGGTPGFGFANFVIYFGWVAGLGDPFPFSRFYAVLAPLGLFLLHRQLRERSLSATMVNGSIALLASVYLSRIVNPNYLTLAVLFVPLAVLRDRRLAPDLAVVPVALMMLGLEFSGHELLRTTWHAADGLGFVPGLPAWLAPGDGPRWRDPLSLVFSALAAGLGLVYLTVSWAAAHGRAEEGGQAASAAATGESPARQASEPPWRARAALVALAAMLVVVLPAWLVVRAGEAARTVRGEDRWLVDVRGEARLDRVDGRLVPPAPVLEAFPRSFHKRGEKAYGLEEGASPRAALGRLAGGVDARWLSLVALAAAAALAARRVAPHAQLAVLGVLLLSPLAAGGAIFGSGAALALALLIAAACASRAVERGSGRGALSPLSWGVAGTAAGAAAALFPETWVAWPLVTIVGAAPSPHDSAPNRDAGEGTPSPVRRAGQTRAAFLVGFAGAFVSLWAAAWLASAQAGRVTPTAGEPALPLVRVADAAVGLTSLLAYHGAEDARSVATWTRLAAPTFALVGLGLAWRRWRSTTGAPADWGAAAAALLGALWLWPAAEAHALLVPLALALLGAEPRDGAS